MINYILIHKDNDVINITGIFDTREEAEAKKRQREEEERNWKIWDRHEYIIVVYAE